MGVWLWLSVLFFDIAYILLCDNLLFCVLFDTLWFILLRSVAYLAFDLVDFVVFSLFGGFATHILSFCCFGSGWAQHGVLGFLMVCIFGLRVGWCFDFVGLWV